MKFIENEQQYQEAYRLSISDPSLFWNDIADTFNWIKKYDSVCVEDMVNANNRWFDGGQLNISENCIDRHLMQNADKIAIHWEPNDPSEDSKNITFQNLHDEVCKVANALIALGVKKGDAVCIYMPMVPELLYAMHACARIGAVHSVVFAGFSGQSLAMRIEDCNAKVLLTAATIHRGSKAIDVVPLIKEAMSLATNLLTIVGMDMDADTTGACSVFNWNSLVSGQSNVCKPTVMLAEDPLFILYTSGSTGKPKGVVHTVAGYMVYAAYSFAQVFQTKYDDVFWCTADAGWITGHSYFCYGPLLNGTTTIMFEGVPNYPEANRFWQIIEKFKVTHFYTAPTAIRALMACGNDFPESFAMESLAVIGSVGEPINEEAFDWYANFVGKNKCDVVDTWWQTETGGIMLSSLKNVGAAPACHAGRPLPGIVPVLLSTDGKIIHEPNKEGLLCIKNSWPSIIRTTHGDHQRCIDTYFKPFHGYYFTGDAAKMDENGFFRIIGRVDDVINVSGHRIGTAEVENAINMHLDIVESAAVGVPHAVKGQCIYAFVVLLDGHTLDHKNMQNEINKIIEESIGKLAKPDFVQIVSALPKTRSGKIMRRILRKIGENDNSNFGDTSTLLDPTVVEVIWEKRLIK
jgi:acetyl-CoA synthetase